MWLDTGELSLADCNGYPQWSIEAVQGLAQEWQEAQPILDQVQHLLDWHNESPDTVHSKLTAVRDALQTAYQRSQGCYQLPLALEMER
jgi:hypothetical protein